MPWKPSCVFLALCLLGVNLSSGQALRNKNFSPYAPRRDIEFDKDPVETVYTGSGFDGRLLYTDDEDFMVSGSGSGSGSGFGDEADVVVPVKLTTPKKAVPSAVSTAATSSSTTTSTTTTDSHPRTVCERQRHTSQQMLGKFTPRCLDNGDFASLQCHGNRGDEDCWCSDLEGMEIPGTLMEAPNYPNCDEGYNLAPCVYQLVKHVRSKLLGSFRPHCAVDGQFDRIQCLGSMCFCVYESTGQGITGTEVHIPDSPNCDDDSSDVAISDTTTVRSLKPDRKETMSEEDRIVIDENGPDSEILFPETEDPNETLDLDVNVGGNRKHTEAEEDPIEETNQTELGTEGEIGKTDNRREKVEEAGRIMTQPGILAGIIGGSVVFLLCLVLLVMFIIYRMRKKDEGSYPLEEPRRTPNYSYVRAPAREFYA